LRSQRSARKQSQRQGWIISLRDACLRHAARKEYAIAGNDEIT